MKYLALVLTSLLSLQAFSQSNESFWEDSLRMYEQRLAVISDSLVNSKSQFTRQQSAKEMIKAVRKTMSMPGAYQYPFDELTHISKLRPEDDAFRMFVWVLELDKEYQYFGVIHMNDPKRFVYHPLFDRSKNEKPRLSEEEGPNDRHEFEVYDNKEWFGMLYYNVGMVQNSSLFGLLKGKKYYMLTGWDGNNGISHKKIVDVLHFEKGVPTFGAPLFSENGATKMRKVLEFNAQATITLRFHANEKMIAFDHLVPPSRKNEGQKFTYIPSGQYDYLEWKNGKWVFQEDLFNNYSGQLSDAR